MGLDRLADLNSAERQLIDVSRCFPSLQNCPIGERNRSITGIDFRNDEILVFIETSRQVVQVRAFADAAKDPLDAVFLLNFQFGTGLWWLGLADRNSFVV